MLYSIPTVLALYQYKRNKSCEKRVHSLQIRVWPRCVYTRFKFPCGLGKRRIMIMEMKINFKINLLALNRDRTKQQNANGDYFGKTRKKSIGYLYCWRFSSVCYSMLMNAFFWNLISVQSLKCVAKLLAFGSRLDSAHISSAKSVLLSYVSLSILFSMMWLFRSCLFGDMLQTQETYSPANSNDTVTEKNTKNGLW